MIFLSQRDVLAIMEKTPEDWVSLDYLIEILHISKTSVQQNVRCLIKAGWIEVKYERVKLREKGTFRWAAYYRLTNLYLCLNGVCGKDDI